MDISSLRDELDDIKQGLENSITTATFRGEPRENGLAAKKSFINSNDLIMPIHEVVKEDLQDELNNRNINHEIHPPIGETSPELNFYGYLKSKKQDIVVLFDSLNPEVIPEGPQENEEDPVGKNTSERAIVIGVRSQMSSVAKNFDTMVERLFAETLNLRLRLDALTMGEVYLLPVFPYKSEPMKQNNIAFKDEPTIVESFLRVFSSFSGRSTNNYNGKDQYKYERSALLLTDFRYSPPKVYETTRELKSDNIIDSDFDNLYDDLSPRDFVEDIIDAHLDRHSQIN